MKYFTLPDLGEGLPDAEIVRWYAKEGELIKTDSPLVAMETAKAVVDVPSPFSGKIKKLYGKPGDIIITGAVLVEFETDREDTGTVAGVLEVSDKIIPAQAIQPAHAKATPAVRALAQRLNVDLATVLATGPDNTITSKDVEQAGILEPLKSVRRAMAQAMEKSHLEIVPVTIVEDAILLNYSAQTDISVLIMQALLKACAAEPALNAWYDGKAMGRRLIQQLDLGLAIDTVDGLFVPVINNVGSKSAAELRSEIDSLKLQVQNRTLKPEAMRGSSFVLSNFGSLAGRYASPIIMPPCVAILGVGKIRDAVVPINGQPAIAKLLPLSLSFDHRACTGGEASRFLGVLVENLNSFS